MKLFYILLVVAVILSITSCENDSNEIDITLEFNETYYHPGGTFSLKIDSVLNDSRCPKGAVCIWAGNAEIRFIIKTLNDFEQTFQLNSYIEPTSTVINNFNFKLINVLPYPEDFKIEQEDYSVKLRIKRISY